MEKCHFPRLANPLPTYSDPISLATYPLTSNGRSGEEPTKREYLQTYVGIHESAIADITPSRFCMEYVRSMEPNTTFAFGYCKMETTELKTS